MTGWSGVKVTCGALVALLATAWLLNGCTTEAAPTANTPVTSILTARDSGLNVKWQKQVGMAVSRHEKVEGIWRVADMVYVATSEHQIHAIDARQGTLSWTSDLGTYGYEIFRPVELGNGAILIASQSQLFVLNKKSGEIINQAALTFAATTDPVVADQTLVLGSSGDKMYGLYLDFLGRIKWSHWSRDDAFNSSPALSFGKQVMVASKLGFIWSLNAADGEAVWARRRVGGEVTAPLAVDPKAVYVAALDNKVYAFDALKGDHLWDTYLEGKLDQAPLTPGGSVYVVGSGKGLYSLTVDKGEIKWFVPGVKRVLARAPDRLLALDEQSNLLVIASDTGTVDKTLPMPGVSRWAFNTIDGTAYGVTPDGRVVAMEILR